MSAYRRKKAAEAVSLPPVKWKLSLSEEASGRLVIRGVSPGKLACAIAEVTVRVDPGNIRMCAGQNADQSFSPRLSAISWARPLVRVLPTIAAR